MLENVLQHLEEETIMKGKMIIVESRRNDVNDLTYILCENMSLSPLWVILYGTDWRVYILRDDIKYLYQHTHRWEPMKDRRTHNITYDLCDPRLLPNDELFNLVTDDKGKVIDHMETY